MKAYYLFFIGAIFLAGCADKEERKEKKESRPARIDSVVSRMMPAPDTPVQPEDTIIPIEDKTSPPHTGIIISGTVFYTRPYCGGIVPSEEQKRMSMQRKRLPHSKLILKTGSAEYVIQTNGKGDFSTYAPPGEYKIWLTEEINPAVYSVKPDDCRNCLVEPIADATLIANKKNILAFNFRCGPNRAE
ncbi:MAG TPA: hypothetical protein VI731_07870 [Bacteroidia bacterium]|nr:hypothetical protein [Bacteroidia bacterium]